MNTLYNRLHNSRNPYQGDAKKILCVCSAGLLRSPTMAVVLSQEPYSYNTRAVGVDEGHALIPMDLVQIHWADEIIFVSDSVRRTADAFFNEEPTYQETHKVTLDIPDCFEYRNPKLIEAIKKQYDDHLQISAKS